MSGIKKLERPMARKTKATRSLFMAKGFSQGLCWVDLADSPTRALFRFATSRRCRAFTSNSNVGVDGLAGGPLLPHSQTRECPISRLSARNGAFVYFKRNGSSRDFK